MEILKHNKRKQKLIAFGIPLSFITHLEEVESVWRIANPVDSYIELKKKHKNNEVLRNYNLVPVFESFNDAERYVILYAFNDKEKKLISYGFDDVHENIDYIDNFQLSLLEELIELYAQLMMLVDTGEGYDLKEEENSFLNVSKNLCFKDPQKLLHFLKQNITTISHLKTLLNI